LKDTIPLKIARHPYLYGIGAGLVAGGGILGIKKVLSKKKES
jgi:hypothetical protein